VHNLELYHICGSLIMAYSFNDELQKTDKKKEDYAEEDEEDEDDEEDEEEEEEEDQGLISMVPMADMLNHKTGYNNARLFHEPDSLQMRAIKDIAEGEQIYNTYGDLCNADLLRKYGFADENNEFDIVELDGKLIVDCCCPDQDEELVEKKVISRKKRP
jgi:SET domain-containing protein 6